MCKFNINNVCTNDEYFCTEDKDCYQKTFDDPEFVEMLIHEDEGKRPAWRDSFDDY